MAEAPEDALDKEAREALAKFFPDVNVLLRPEGDRLEWHLFWHTSLWTGLCIYYGNLHGREPAWAAMITRGNRTTMPLGPAAGRTAEAVARFLFDEVAHLTRVAADDIATIRQQLNKYSASLTVPGAEGGVCPLRS